MQPYSSCATTECNLRGQCALHIANARPSPWKAYSTLNRSAAIVCSSFRPVTPDYDALVRDIILRDIEGRSGEPLVVSLTREMNSAHRRGVAQMGTLLQLVTMALDKGDVRGLEGQ